MNVSEFFFPLFYLKTEKQVDDQPIHSSIISRMCQPFNYFFPGIRELENNLFLLLTNSKKGIRKLAYFCSY
jgi:hypothetical protein